MMAAAEVADWAAADWAVAWVEISCLELVERKKK